MGASSRRHLRRASHPALEACGLCLGAALILACGDRDVTTSDPGVGGTAGTGGAAGAGGDGSAQPPAAEPITGPCPAPVGDAEDLALTPRADSNLELLALELEPERVVASEETYDRLVSDVEVSFFNWHDGRHIQLQWTDAAAQSFAAGLYTAWDCLNAAYGLVSVSAPDSWVTLELEGIYNLPLVLERYRQLPGVISGSYGGAIDDGPTICVTREADRYEYVFDDTGGYCAEPCPQHRAYHFASDAAGQVASLDVWDSTTGAPIPAWFGAVCEFQPNVGL
jgi:hypothetical protein